MSLPDADVRLHSAGGDTWVMAASTLTADRTYTLANLGARVGGRLVLSRWLDYTPFDVVVRNSEGVALATLTRSAACAEFLYTWRGWVLYRRFARTPAPVLAGQEAAE